MLLLDVVLGYGAEPDPAALLAPALSGHGSRPWSRWSASTSDPQGLDRQVRALADAGAEVHLSNAGRTRRAVERGFDLRRGGVVSTPSAVVNVGADLLADAIADQAVPVTRVDWRPPMEGPRQTWPPWRPTRAAPPPTRRRWPPCSRSPRASSTSPRPLRLLGLEKGQFLHAGPPITGTGRPDRSAAR